MSEKTYFFLYVPQGNYKSRKKTAAEHCAAMLFLRPRRHKVWMRRRSFFKVVPRSSGSNHGSAQCQVVSHEGGGGFRREASVTLG